MILSKKILDHTLDDNEQSFSIKQKDMGIILEILRSKLYSDPIGSICREIACNARDANREVGKFNTPIEISFVKLFEDDDEVCVTFKDEGPGISPDRISDVFINYGSSTKRDDNIQTGGFGIGAKVPFCYTDNFYIITIVDNIKYVYRAVITNNNNGSLFLHSKQETNEPNGTTVSIPIKEIDRKKFEKNIYYYTLLWNTKPTYNNFINENVGLNIIHKNEKGLTVNNYGCDTLKNASVYVNIDGILYESNLKVCDNYYVCYASVILNYNIGDLTISANRETLHFDKKTEDRIKTDYNRYIDDLHDYTSNKINEHKCLLDAVNYYNKIFPQLLTPIFEHKELNSISYNNINLNHNYLNNLEHICVMFNSKQHRGSRSISNFDKDYDYGVFYIINKKTKNVLREDYLYEKHSKGYISIVVKNKSLLLWKKFGYKDKKKYSKQLRGVINDIKTLQSYGCNVMLYSDIKIPKTERVKQIYNNNIKKIKVQINGINYIKPISYLKSTHYYSTTTDNKYANYLEMIHSKKLAVVTESNVVHVKDVMESYDQLLERTDKKQFNDISTYKYLKSNSIDNLNEYKKLHFNVDLRNAIDYIIDERKRIYDSLKGFNQITEEFMTEYPPNNEVIEKINIIKTYFDNYKMLDLFNCSYLSEENLVTVNEYIKIMDERNEKLCHTSPKI